MTSEYPDFVFVVYDGDTSDQTYDITVSCEAGTLVGKPVKYIRHDLNTRAVPNVPELVRYGANRAEYFDGTMEKDPRGKYVLHSQAAEIIAAKDAERNKDITAWRDVFDSMHRRAMEAEAKNIELEAAWLNAEGKISDLEAKLAQYEAQKPVGYVTDRVKTRDGQDWSEWLDWRDGKSPENSVRTEYETRYLYASPAPAADLRAENEKLRVALEFYADKANWEAGDFQHSVDEHLGHNVLTLNMPQAVNDQGKIARSALTPSEPRT